MRFLLDTNVVIQLLRGDDVVLGHLRSHLPSDLALSAMVYHELIFGAHRSQNPDRSLERVRALAFEVLPFNRNDAAIAGRIRADLVSNGAMIGLVDALIAAQAVARNLTVVTHNIREFGRVPDLVIVDWQASAE